MFGWLFGKKKAPVVEAVEVAETEITPETAPSDVTITAFEKMMAAHQAQWLEALDVKFEKMYQRLVKDAIKLNDIHQELSQLSATMQELDYAATEMTTVAQTTSSSQAVTDMHYQIARKLIQEGQPIHVIIQRTNLSRDEISILKSLVTV